MHVVRRDVHMAEKMLVHEVVIALRMRHRQPHVVVEGERGYVRDIQHVPRVHATYTNMCVMLSQNTTIYKKDVRASRTVSLTYASMQYSMVRTRQILSWNRRAASIISATG